jgi:hypothetical protein
MVMKLDQVVPFGRSLNEYEHMFALSKADLQKRIIGVADGPASFNAELTAKQGSIVSVDPIYALSPEGIQRRFDQVLPNIMHQVEATPDDWVWSYHQSPDQLKERRTQVTRDFVQDFTQAKNSDRYVTGTLPELQFKNGSFDLALCSHFLFLYADQFSLDFHLASIREMLRVASEARIFPILKLDLKHPSFLESLLKTLKEEQYETSIEIVPYELQRGGNEMLRIARRSRIQEK